MPTLDVINVEKKKVGTVDLSDEVFGSQVAAKALRRPR
jgi:ribosomal protein L4